MRDRLRSCENGYDVSGQASSGSPDDEPALDDSLLVHDRETLSRIRRCSKQALQRHSLRPEGFETRYALGRKVGEGMHSVVYECFQAGDEKRQRPFAVKVSREDDEEKKMAHRREFKLTRQLDHPNLVNSYEFFENEFTGEIHLVMNLFKGVELFDLLDEEKPLTEMEAKVIAKQMVDALAYLHKNHIVHRDLKPQNILISEDRVVQIIDFNVSRKFDSSQPKLMTKTGSPEYSAPEMLSQTTYDHKVDVWSAGVVLYQILCGKPLFADENIAKLVQDIQTRDLT